MKRIITLTIALAFVVVISAGCAALLEADRLIERPHLTNPVVRPVGEQIEVTNFDELKDAIIELIMTHETSGRIVALTYESEDLQFDVDRAIEEILTYHPIAVFAVNEIIGSVTKIVAIAEINISIEYSQTMQQIDAIKNVELISDLEEQLLELMRDYRDDALFRTPLQLTADEVAALITDIYYQNPRKIVMRPVVAVEVFPEEGEDRIFEISFDFGRPAGILRSLGGSLTLALQSNIEAAEGDTDSEILLSLAKNLIAFADYDEVTSRIPEHGPQNLAATAFGALINGNAIGEGFAMAFKALCDELGIEARVVLGYIEGRHHAWNLVYLYGYFYHIDVAMGDVNGLETAFLKTDAQLRARRYTWDFAGMPRANGALTFEDVAGIQEPYYDPYGEINGEPKEDQDEASDANEAQRPPQRPTPNVPQPPPVSDDTDTESPEEPAEPDLPEEPPPPDEPLENEPPDELQEPDDPPEPPDLPEEPDEPEEPQLQSI